MDHQQVVGLGDGDHFQLDPLLVAADEQQPVVQIAGAGDDGGSPASRMAWIARVLPMRCLREDVVNRTSSTATLCQT